MILALLALALQTLDGRAVDPFAAKATAHAFVFVHTDCPVSNKYVPELNRLHADFSSRGIRLWVVYPGRNEDSPAIRAHHAEYGLRVPALLDPDFELADLAGATMTPEAAVFTPDGRLVYRGRIDDRAVRLGLVRAAPRTRDLAGVLDRLARGERVEAFTTQAVGCYIR
jgi:hypothetical protein